MKKIMLGLALLFALGSATKINAQERIKYYYYPSTNVYYSPTTGDYWYYDTPTTTWVTVKTLPKTVVVDKTTKYYVVYYNGKDPWKNNETDKKKYKAKKTG